MQIHSKPLCMGRTQRESLAPLLSEVIGEDKADYPDIAAFSDTLTSPAALQEDRPNTSVFHSEMSTF